MDQNEGVTFFTEFMARNGFSNTSQRRVIAQVFFSIPGHHTLEEFYQYVNQLDPSIGQTTVYRTLKLLCAAGLASEIQFSDNISRYEIANPNTHHDHLLCLKCGKIVEIYDSRIEEIQKDVAEKNGFTLSGHTHNLYGLCSICSK